jgi:hypothetical protein
MVVGKFLWESSGKAPRIRSERSTLNRTTFTLRQRAPGNERMDRRLGGPQNLSGRGGEEKYPFPPAGNRTPVVQPGASHFTDLAIPAISIFHSVKVEGKVVPVLN